jgi:SAM-dependent methyltransferase
VLQRECGLSANSIVVDVGSGTGLLSELFLRLGCEVYGVEPNVDMRKAGERFLASYRGFHSINGTAEATGLPVEIADFVTAGQAFHWFETTPARVEFQRILRPRGWVALVWNVRRAMGSPFMAAYEDLLRRYAPEYPEAEHTRISLDEIARFFGDANWRGTTFPNSQIFDFEALVGRLNSSSYAPQAVDPDYPAMMADLGRIFDTYSEQGRVMFLYDTRLYYGRLARPNTA